jgi:cytochrome P450
VECAGVLSGKLAKERKLAKKSVPGLGAAGIAAPMLTVMSETDSTALPPGPPLPRVVQAALRLSPYYARFSAACRRRYGSAYTLRMAFVGTVVHLSDPADIKELFAGDPAIYHAGEANSMLTGILGDSSVLVIDEDVHRYRRRLMLAPFRPEAVARQAPVMAEIAAANIAKWPVGKEFPAAQRMAEITLEVIMRTVIGANEPTRLAALREVLERLMRLGSLAALCIFYPELQRHGPWRRVRRRIEEVERLLYAEIADRRADPNLAARTDALALLVRATDDDGRTMTDRELRDQLMTLLIVGHDTTTSGLSWALERLTRNPAVLTKAVAAAEASAAGDPTGDEYLDALVKETLRIRPVLWDAGRVLTRPTEVAGYRLPAGVLVGASIGNVHRSAKQYPNPDRFDPGRMIGATLSPTTWLPFGGGNRRCLGANLAMGEMKVVLREVLRRVELGTTTAPGELPKVRAGVLLPQRGARIRVRAKRDVIAASPVGPQACPVTAKTTPVPTASADGVAGSDAESVDQSGDRS